MGSMVIVDPAWLARQGFVVIVQDTRGRGESDGDFDIVYQEVDDGYDTVEWAAAQPWSTGNVGIYGSSYMGITTYQASASKAPHLKAGVAFIGTTCPLEERLTGGIFEAVFMTWYAYLTVFMTVDRMEIDPARKADLLGRIGAALADPVATGSQLPLTDCDVINEPEIAPFWQDCMAEPNAPQRERFHVLGDDHDIGDVALLHISGYRDFVGEYGFRLAAAQAGNPNHRFIATPYTHRGPYTGATGVKEFPGTSSPAGPLGWGPLLAAWFDIHLRGGTGADYPLGMTWLEGEPVRYYLEGEDRWEQAPRWPPATTATELTLSSAGDARSSAGSGRLAFATSSGEGADSFTADPHDPFPTCGGGFGIPEQGPEGVQDQRRVDHRDDVLVYTTDVLEAPVRIAGEPEALLRLSSTAPDADVIVKLVDVHPDGFAYNVSEGWQRIRYRNGGTSAWLEPGQTTDVAVTLHNTAHVFKPGHRIRLMISGASWPRLTRNLHTRTVPEWGTLEEAVTADHTVHHVGSRLVLHTMPA
jgi:putative CocE/NonD family hydrolase